MKRKIMMACLVVCAVVAIGCNGQDNVQKHDETVNSTEIIKETEEYIEQREVSEELGESKDISGRTSYEGERYVWGEISITIPQAWTDKYVMKEDANGISFYQKASNEKEETLGFLCGIYRTGQYSNYGAGEELVAYTDEGMLYYVIEPTDMNCYMEDEGIVREYNEMIPYVKWIAGNMEISAENVHYDVKQYEIPVSSIVPLEEHHLLNLTNNQLWIARNEIYARHGKVFQDEYLASYFEACSWYEAKEDKNEVSDRELNEVEIANLKLIVAAEENYEKEHPYPKQYATGEQIEVQLYDNEEMQHVCYEVSVEDDWEYECVLTIDEKVYDLEEYISLVSPVADVFYITDIAQYDNRLEIAVMDDGPSDDPVTHFFQYDGSLYYVGEVQGFPFDDYGNSPFDGFSGQNSVIGTCKQDLIESAYVYTYYWYNSNERTLERMERVRSNYTWFHPHALYVDIPVYYSMDVQAPVLTLPAQEAVYFIATDCKEWILVRDGNGIEGYIRVKNGRILNVDLPAEEVFSELYFFD